MRQNEPPGVRRRLLLRTEGGVSGGGELRKENEVGDPFAQQSALSLGSDTVAADP